MDSENNELNTIQFIRELCKEKTEDELLEIEQNFREFLLVIKEISDRLEIEGKDLSDFDDKLLE
jgi:hypothetical protein